MNIFVNFHLFSKWIVSGPLGENGPHVPKHVELEPKLKRELKPQKPKMEERNAVAVVGQQNIAIKENVLQVK